MLCRHTPCALCRQATTHLGQPLLSGRPLPSLPSLPPLTSGLAALLVQLLVHEPPALQLCLRQLGLVLPAPLQPLRHVRHGQGVLLGAGAVAERQPLAGQVPLQGGHVAACGRISWQLPLLLQVLHQCPAAVVGAGGEGQGGLPSCQLLGGVGGRPAPACADVQALAAAELVNQARLVSMVLDAEPLQRGRAVVGGQHVSKKQVRTLEGGSDAHSGGCGRFGAGEGKEWPAGPSSPSYALFPPATCAPLPYGSCGPTTKVNGQAWGLWHSIALPWLTAQHTLVCPTAARAAGTMHPMPTPARHRAAVLESSIAI